MSLFDRLTSLFAPDDCLSCGQEGSLLCARCIDKLLPLPARCFRCRKLTLAWRGCDTCRRATKLTTVRAVTVYDGIAKELTWHLKFHGAQSAARIMARQMAKLVSEDTNALLVHVPTATQRIRQRGYDQARLLATALARETYLPHVAGLARVGQHHQVGAHRQQRLTQLAGAFRVTKPALVSGRHIILIDDVLTTGATITAAAHALKAAGAKQIDALVFAQA